MNIYLTLDYELFFGEKSGDLDSCIIRPTNELIRIADKYQIKLTFFVDVGYLIQLKNYRDQFPALKNDYKKVTSQIKILVNSGHAIALHIHPHWENAVYQNNKWLFNNTRYKLTDFSKEEIFDIVNRYKKELESVSGQKIKIYRAGGWSIQPFKNIGKALSDNNVLIDSTVYPNGFYQSDHQSFDFRGAPMHKTKWQFSEDPVMEDQNGIFTEIPISSIKVSPLFFWKFAFTKILKQKKHQAYGNGNAISMNKSQVFKLLLKPSYSVVSMDGYKAVLLNKALKKYEKLEEEETNFVVIGHPKAFSKYSLKKLEGFIEQNHINHNFTTL